MSYSNSIHRKRFPGKVENWRSFSWPHSSVRHGVAHWPPS